MSVTLTDEQYRVLVTALLDVAHGQWFLHGKQNRRMSQSDCVERCRKAAIKLGLDWSEHRPERVSR